MKKIRDILSQSEFHLLLFFIGFLLLNWPITSGFQHLHPVALLVFLFLVWLVLIALLVLICRGIRQKLREIGRSSQRGRS